MDDLLREAVWPEVTTSQSMRIRAAWRRRSRRRQQKRTAIIGVAGIVLMSVFVGSWPRWELGIVGAGRDDSTMARWRPASTGDAPERQTSIRTPRPDTSRRKGLRGKTHAAAAKFRDRLAMALANRAARRRQGRAPRNLALLHKALDRLSADPSADVRRLARRLSRESLLTEQRLLELVQRLDGLRRQAAVRLLCCMATRRTLPILVQLAQSPETHRPATRALARIVDAPTLARLVVAEPSRALQRELLAALAGRGDPMSTRLYLNFVRQPEMATVALEAIEDAPHVPLDQLFSLLRDQRVRVRMAAARVLGHLNDSVVSQRLADIVLRDPAPHSALAALASSADPIAARFLAAARHDILLAGPLQAARARARSWNN